MYSLGMKASELIKLLQEKIEEHGDWPVYSGGTDYPEGVRDIRVIEEGKGNGYTPDNSFYIS